MNGIDQETLIESSYNDTTNLTVYPTTNLEPDEKYRCHVKYYSQDQESIWSEDVLFKTAADSGSVTNEWSMTDGGLYIYTPESTD